MPVKIARSTPGPLFGLRELLVASHISRLASRDATKSLLSTLVSESSGECRLNPSMFIRSKALPKRSIGPRRSVNSQKATNTLFTDNRRAPKAAAGLELPRLMGRHDPPSRALLQSLHCSRMRASALDKAFI
jgi:hypothetical protein